MKSLFRQFNQNLVITNPDSIMILCSQYEYDNNQCEQYKIDLMEKNGFYLNKWFHRYYQSFDELPSNDKKQLIESTNLLFYGKVVQASKKNSLLSINQFVQLFNSTLVTNSQAAMFKFQDTPTKDTCIDSNGLYNFDVRCVDWYQYAMNSSELQITEPTVMSFRKEVYFFEVKRATAEDDQNQSVLAANIGFTNFMQNILKIQDQSQSTLESNGYNVLMHSKNGELIFHRNWDPSNGFTSKWVEAEYPSDQSSDQNEINSFTSNFKKVLEECKKSEFVFMNNQADSSRFSFEFQKQGIPYIGTVLPVEIQFLSKGEFNGKSNQLVLGRVEKDLHLKILESSLKFDTMSLIISVSGSSFISFIIIVAGIHLFAVLNRSIDIPISLLCQFLVWQDWNLRELQDNQRQQKQQVQQELDSSSGMQQSHIFSRFNPSQQFAKFKPQKRVSQQSKNLLKNSPGIISSNDNLLRSYRNSKVRTERFDSVALSSESNQLIPTRRSQYQHRSNLIRTSFSQEEQQQQQFEMITAGATEIVDIPQLVQLEDIQSGFQEMDVIVNVFQKMENVIKSAIVSDVSGDSDNSILSYSTLNQMYRISNNQQGMSNCFTTIGILCLKKNAFYEATRSLEISIFHTLNSLFEMDSLIEFRIQFKRGMISNKYLPRMNKICYQLRLYSLALLLTGKSIQSSIGYSEKESYFIHAKTHILLAKQICKQYNKSDLRESKLISLLLAEIDIQNGNLISAQKELDTLISKSNPVWDHIKSYHQFLQSQLKFFENHETEALMILDSIMESSLQLDAYVMKNALDLIEGILKKNIGIQDQVNEIIGQEISMFSLKQFEFFFFVNVENEEDSTRSARIIRKITSEFCNEEDIFTFLKINREGITQLQNGKIKQKEHLNNCLLEIQYGTTPLIYGETKSQTPKSSILSRLLNLIHGKNDSSRLRNWERILILFDSNDINWISNESLSELRQKDKISLIHVTPNTATIKRSSFFGYLHSSGENNEQYQFIDRAQNTKEILQILNKKRIKKCEFSKMYIS